MSSKQNAEIIASDNGFAVAVDGEIVRAGFVSRGHASMWATRQKLYERKTPPRRPVEIPLALEDEAILPIPLLAKLSGWVTRVFWRRPKPECSANIAWRWVRSRRSASDSGKQNPVGHRIPCARGSMDEMLDQIR